MARSDNSDSGTALKTATRSAFVTFCVVVCGSLAKAFINDLFNGKWQVDWKLIFVLSAFASALVFIWVFVSGYFSLRATGPAAAILDRDPSLSMSPGDAMSGFVGMEYYGLILNRTYVVFVAQDGLYGWKAEGPVSGERKGFYEPYQRMLDAPELMRDREAVQDLSKLRGGFFIPGSDIAFVHATDKNKWGMGSIAHSGRILIGLTSGKSREFIALGSVSPEVIRDRILAICLGCNLNPFISSSA